MNNQILKYNKKTDNITTTVILFNFYLFYFKVRLIEGWPLKFYKLK